VAVVRVVRQCLARRADSVKHDLERTIDPCRWK
jgi:hypothetical protein